MDNDNKTTVGPKLERMMRASNARVIKDDTTRRTAARKAYRAKIESLFDESRDERLADVWQRLYPFGSRHFLELPLGCPTHRALVRSLAQNRVAALVADVHGASRQILAVATSGSR
jgi:hypothetical protein